MMPQVLKRQLCGGCVADPGPLQGQDSVALNDLSADLAFRFAQGWLIEKRCLLSISLPEKVQLRRSHDPSKCLTCRKHREGQPIEVRLPAARAKRQEVSPPASCWLGPWSAIHHFSKGDMLEDQET